MSQLSAGSDRPASPAAIGHSSPTALPSPGRAAAYGVGRGLLSGVLATAAIRPSWSWRKRAASSARCLHKRSPSTFSVSSAFATPPRSPRVARSRRSPTSPSARSSGSGRRSRTYAAPHAGRRPSIGAGVVFGTAIGAVSYAGWVSALGIMPRPHNDRPGRQPSMLLAHWVYGATLAKLVG